MIINKSLSTEDGVLHLGVGRRRQTHREMKRRTDRDRCSGESWETNINRTKIGIQERLGNCFEHKWKINRDPVYLRICFLGQKTGSPLTWTFLGSHRQFLHLGRRGYGRGSEMELAVPGASWRPPPGGTAMARACGFHNPRTHIHPRPVVDKTFTNPVREKCGHL